MPRGGSKPGERRGGRQQGAANKRTREIADKAVQAGITPLEYLLSILRDEKEERSVRIDAAKASAPYIHPRLQNTTVKIPDGLDIRMIERVIVREK